MAKFERDETYWVIFNSIKKHAGLSVFDDPAVHEEVLAILKSLKKNRMRVVRFYSSKDDKNAQA